MASREEGAPPELKDFQISSSWFPSTPAKPNSTTQNPICGNLQADDPCQPNWAEPGQFNPVPHPILCQLGQLPVEDYAGNSQCQAATACYIPADLVDVSRHPNNWQADNAPNSVYEESLSSFDTWQSSKPAESSARGDIFYTPDKYPTRDVDSFGNMSFQTLLAMADAGGSQVALNNVLTDGACVGTGSCCTDPRCNLPFETRQYAMNCGNSRLQGQVMRQATFGTELDMASVFTGVSSGPPRMPFDLNLLPRTMTTDAAFSKNHQFLFEPITPQKNNKGEYQQDPVTGKDAEKNIISGDRVMEPLGNKEKLHQFIDQSSAATSAQLQENHKPDKGGTDEVDFTKTPQQKPRRKKHRPKVIIEGQKKSTPKSTAKTPSGVQETTRVKRKYVRRKGVGIPSVEEFNGIGVNHKEVSSTDAPTSGRKYTRRKVANKPGVDLDKETPKATDAVPPRHTRSSCKRTLNFIPDGQVGDESSSHSMNQLQEDNSSNMDPLKDNNMLGGDQTLQSRGKCQIVFSDVTHDKEANTVQVRMNPDSQMMPKSPGDSICSSACLTPERQVTGLKRQNMGTVAESEIYNSNEAGTVYNFMQGYTPIFSQNADKNNGSPGFHFPTIYKKKRTEKGHNMVASSSQQTRPTSENHVRLHIQSLRGSFTSQLASVTNQWSSSGQCQVTNLLSTNPGIDGAQNGRRSFGDLLGLGPSESIRKRRSKGPTRQRNLASLLEICGQLPASTSGATTSRMRQHIAFEQEPPTCMEALVANTRLTMATKKRSKRSMLINPPVQNVYNHQKSDTTSMGPPLSLTWRYMSPVDSIVEQLSQLDLNAQSSQASVDKRNAFMAYHTNYLEQHAIVPYQRSGAVVPFGGSFDQVRRRRPRPKVDLDDETTRVWKLLLENINSEGIDGTDEEKTKWWEEERRVFNGRADSFIARMHLVQGDRRFSPWKGSVVDSVVGVFLTQNVSDHLSSSAFMSMAARFPLKSKTRSSDLHEEELGAEEACGLDPDATFDNINQSVCGDNTKMRQDFEVEGIREVNSINTSGNNTDGFILKDTLGCQSPNTSKNGGVMSHEPATDKSASLIEDGREAEDTFSSRTPEISSQNSSDSTIAQTTERSDSCLPSTSEEPTAGADTNIFNNPTSFVKLLQMAGNVIHGDYEGRDKTNYGDNQKVQSERLTLDLQNEAHLNNPMFPAETIAPSSKSTMCDVPNSGSHRTVSGLSKQNSKFFNSSCGNELSSADISDLSSESASGTTFQKIADANFEVAPKSVSTHATSSNNVQGEINQRGQVPAQSLFQENQKMQEASESQIYPQNLMDITGSSNNMDNFKNPEHKEVNSSKTGPEKHRGKKVDGSKAKPGRPRKENEKRENQADWDQLRKDTLIGGTERAKTANTMDSVDWDAVRCADVNEIAQTIKERGMNNMLAERIKDFLNRIVRDHGSIDLEWLRDVPPDKAKEYLLSIWGLGLKSVECVRLLTLHHLAFPVDTNVGRIAVRLGWVPLQPLPESLQLHLLEMYPILESIQKYLWPRLCKLDQRTLYELHYQMITFGKVFCTKSKPNCNACPMRGECRHFASAFASARLALPAPEEKGIVKATENREAGQNPMRRINTLQLPSPEAKSEGSNSQPIIEEPPEAKSEGSNSQPIIEEPPEAKSEGSNSQPIIEEPPSPEPFTEVPATPEQVYAEGSQCDIENAFMEDPDEIPTIKLNMEEFTHNLQKIMQQNTELQEGDMSKALVALTSAAASIPVPKLKNMNRLRTEHQVYELPESHPLLEGMEKREPDDPSPYLLAIWTPGETADSTEPPERRCSSHEFEKLCTDEACLSCNSIRESNSQTVRGTILIPCRTAMRGSFPLNGTYFQVNEVFSDHESSVSPINVPRHWLWNLPRRTVYFGTSIPTIFKGLTTEGIQYCFWRGFVCVRGFDRKTRAPRPLLARFHFPASRLTKGKGKTDEN